METVTVKGITYEVTAPDQPCYLGRWFDKVVDGIPCKVTATAGARVFFLVEGAEALNVDFLAAYGYVPGASKARYACSVDGKEPVRFLLEQTTVPLPDRKRHAVCLFTDGLPDGAGRWEEELVFALASITPSEGGRLWGLRPQAPLIFFYGDSITEGIHVIGGDDGLWQNSAAYAYPRYCAEALGAIPYFVGYGGSGLLRTGWFHTMENAMEYLSGGYTVADSPYANLTPDLIVMSHGTNDMDYPTMDFLSALRGTLSRLYRRYPDIPVVYVIPLQQTHAAVIRRLMAEYPRGYVVESESWPMSYTDGIHPNAASAKRMGERVAGAIREMGAIGKP